MASQTNERALEASIECSLVGVSREELKVKSDGDGNSQIQETLEPFLTSDGHDYQLGWSADYDRALAVDTAKFWHFLETTQPEQLAKLHNRANWQRQVLEMLDKRIKKHGVLKVLKNGLSIDDAHFTLLYSAPYNDINPEVAKNFNSNIFSVTRQLYYSNTDIHKSIDMVLFINGLPVVTMELKNAWTGQNTYHVKKQYCNDRDPHEPLLQFGRCLVHFAVDTDEVYMTTRLAGKKTYFLPFNKGHNYGKGNPS